MGLNIKNSDAEAAVRALASRTGEGLTEAIESAVREKLARLEERRAVSPEDFLAAVQPLQQAIAEARAANRDTRSGRELVNEIYDDQGLPK